LIYDRYDLVNARFSLPFQPPDLFRTTFDRITASLNPGGLLVGQLFGDRDGWNIAGRKMTFHTMDEAQGILDDWKTIVFREEDRDGLTTLGVRKHWHVFHIIAQRPSASDVVH
jgi:hypothetical protein